MPIPVTGRELALRYEALMRTASDGEVRLYQRALGIGDDSVEWFNDDIADAPFDAADVICLYRPARPMPGGNELYREIARRLSASAGPLAIISVADCMGRHLDSGFRVFYGNEHLTCFLKG